MSGLRVPAHGAPPSRESFHLGRAKRAYIDGLLTLEKLEGSVEHVLRGGTLHADGRIPYSQFPRPQMENIGVNAN